MRIIALALTAAVAAAAGLSATPASAGVYLSFNDGWDHYHRPPPPPPAYYYRPRPHYYAPRPVFYAPPPPPREVCRVRYVRDWGRYGPESRRIEDCRSRW